MDSRFPEALATELLSRFGYIISISVESSVSKRTCLRWTEKKKKVAMSRAEKPLRRRRERGKKAGEGGADRNEDRFTASLKFRFVLRPNSFRSISSSP